MGFSTTQSSAEAWALAEEQEGVISHRQLRALGFSARAIRHRLAKGRLHRRYRGVYVVGRPELSRAGEMMAAVLRCGEGAVLSHESAAELWGIRRRRRGPIEVSVPIPRDPRARGIRVHRRAALGAEDIDKHGAIPITNPIRTLVDLAVRLPRDQLEAAVNEAAISDHVEPEALRASLETRRGQPGVRVLRDILDRHTFRLTDSELERRFLRIVRAAGLPLPETQARVNGHRVDFYWPDLGLIVETDGLRYHRTPAQQANDRRRDQDHAAAGLICLRFPHADVRYAPGRVREVLRRVAR